MMWWNDGGWSGYAVMSVVMLAFWAFVVWAVVASRRPETRQEHGAGLFQSGETPTAGAEHILAERFARGEIDADDYHSHIAELRRQHPAGTRS